MKLPPWILVTKDGIRKLRRDGIFTPALLIALFSIFLSHLFSSWVFEASAQVFEDVFAFGLDLVGFAVAILWGTSIAAKIGTEELMQLAGPISRSSWLGGRFLALVIIIFYMSGVSVALRLAIFPTESWLATIWMWLQHFLGYQLLAAASLLLSMICRARVAVFCAILTLIFGLNAKTLLMHWSATSDPNFHYLFSILADAFNLSRFNVVSYNIIDVDFGLQSFIYSMCATGLLFSLSAFLFTKRDL